MEFQHFFVVWGKRHIIYLKLVVVDVNMPIFYLTIDLKLVDLEFIIYTLPFKPLNKQ